MCSGSNPYLTGQFHSLSLVNVLVARIQKEHMDGLDTGTPVTIRVTLYDSAVTLLSRVKGYRFPSPPMWDTQGV